MRCGAPPTGLSAVLSPARSPFCSWPRRRRRRRPRATSSAPRSEAAALPPAPIGSYAKGCLAGGAMLPTDGPAWQAMRLSRNRNWGHPDADPLPRALLGQGGRRHRLARPAGRRHRAAARRADDDGPRLPPDRPRCRRLAHAHAAAHADPRRARGLRPREHGRGRAGSMSRRTSWTPGPCAPSSARRRRCRASSASSSTPPSRRRCAARPVRDRDWLRRCGPMWGHNYHMHIRLACPRRRGRLRAAGRAGPGDGCGKELDWWFKPTRCCNPKPPASPARR